MKKLWVDEWMPKTIEEVVLKDEYIPQFKKYISERNIPNLLFIGIQGSGKTTMARILMRAVIGSTNEKHPDILWLNGSSDNGIDIVRNLIEGFASVPPIKSPIKICMIDEADYLTANAQGALRNLIEKYQKSTRFIFTGNYVNKIIDPIRSRLTEFFFESLPHDEILKYFSIRLDSKGIKYNPDDVMMIIKKNYPDMRKMINIMQRLTNDNNIIDISELDKYLDNTTKLVDLTLTYISGIQNNMTNNLPHVKDNILNILKREFEIDFKQAYEKLFENKSFPPGINIMISNYCQNLSTHMSPSMNYAAFIYDIEKYFMDRRL